MTDLSALHDELLSGFIIREYQVMHPEIQASATLEDDASRMYRDNPHFHVRVDSIVASVMGIVQKHVAKGESEKLTEEDAQELKRVEADIDEVKHRAE